MSIIVWPSTQWRKEGNVRQGGRVYYTVLITSLYLIKANQATMGRRGEVQKREGRKNRGKMWGWGGGGNGK